MTSNKHHMLDTNIILAMILAKDNSFEDAKKYLESNYLRYISENASDEAETKISNIQIISLEISEFIKNYSDNNYLNFLKLKKEKLEIKKQYLNKYKNKKLPINMPQNRFNDLVFNFFNLNDDEINAVLLTNNNQNLNKLIISSFNKNIINLNDFVNKYYQITFVSSGAKLNDFKNIGAHKKDAILLDEAYHLHLTLNKPVNFITFDADVIDLNDNIHSKISKEVTVSNPIEFIPITN